MDKIMLPEIPFTACYGCDPEEKVIPQPFTVSITMHVSTRQAGEKDDLSLTVDYGDVYLRVKEFCESHSFDLIETLAEKIAGLVLSDVRIFRADVTVTKLAAKAGGVAFPAAVYIERERQ